MDDNIIYTMLKRIEKVKSQEKIVKGCNKDQTCIRTQQTIHLVYLLSHTLPRLTYANGNRVVMIEENSISVQFLIYFMMTLRFVSSLHPTLIYSLCQ